jgi:hypothetical protein
VFNTQTAQWKRQGKIEGMKNENNFLLQLQIEYIEKLHNRKKLHQIFLLNFLKEKVSAKINKEILISNNINCSLPIFFKDIESIINYGFIKLIEKKGDYFLVEITNIGMLIDLEKEIPLNKLPILYSVKKTIKRIFNQTIYFFSFTLGNVLSSIISNIYFKIILIGLGVLVSYIKVSNWIYNKHPKTNNIQKNNTLKEELKTQKTETYPYLLKDSLHSKKEDSLTRKKIE